jgi:hypothetical protein
MVDAYKLLRLPLKQHWAFVCGKKIKNVNQALRAQALTQVGLHGRIKCLV